MVVVRRSHGIVVLCTWVLGRLDDPGPTGTFRASRDQATALSLSFDEAAPARPQRKPIETIIVNLHLHGYSAIPISNLFICVGGLMSFSGFLPLGMQLESNVYANGCYKHVVTDCDGDEIPCPSQNCVDTMPGVVTHAWRCAYDALGNNPGGTAHSWSDYNTVQRYYHNDSRNVTLGTGKKGQLEAKSAPCEKRGPCTCDYGDDEEGSAVPTCTDGTLTDAGGEIQVTPINNDSETCVE